MVLACLVLLHGQATADNHLIEATSPTLQELIDSIANTSVVDDDRKAVRLLTTKISGLYRPVIDCLAAMLMDGRAVLRHNTGIGDLVLWVGGERKGDDWPYDGGGETWEGWFRVEPSGLRRIG